MNSACHEVFPADPPLALLKRLTVRALEPHKYERAGQLLDREHYLGDVPPGRQLLQAMKYDGQWVALLDWGPATWKLADREEWIGWTAQQRAERLGLPHKKATAFYKAPSYTATLTKRTIAPEVLLPGGVPAALATPCLTGSRVAHAMPSFASSGWDRRLRGSVTTSPPTGLNCGFAAPAPPRDTFTFLTPNPPHPQRHPGI